MAAQVALRRQQQAQGENLLSSPNKVSTDTTNPPYYIKTKYDEPDATCIGRRAKNFQRHHLHFTQTSISVTQGFYGLNAVHNLPGACKYLYSYKYPIRINIFSKFCTFYFVENNFSNIIDVHIDVIDTLSDISNI